MKFSQKSVYYKILKSIHSDQVIQEMIAGMLLLGHGV